MTTLATPSLTPQQLLDPTVLEDPYPFYRQLVAEAPVWRIPGTDVVLVSSFDAISEVVNRTSDFSSNLLGLLFAQGGATPEVLAASRVVLLAVLAWLLVRTARGADWIAHSTNSAGIRTVLPSTFELPTFFSSIATADGESTRTPVVPSSFSVYL